MSFQNKYLKYKKKYLFLKKLQGGAFLINVKHISDLIKINHENINLIEGPDHYLVPMNAYQTVNKDSDIILSTTGVQDCVVVAIYNPRYGRYFAHYLRFNEFFN